MHILCISCRINERGEGTRNSCGSLKIVSVTPGVVPNRAFRLRRVRRLSDNERGRCDAEALNLTSSSRRRRNPQAFISPSSSIGVNLTGLENLPEIPKKTRRSSTDLAALALEATNTPPPISERYFKDLPLESDIEEEFWQKKIK